MNRLSDYVTIKVLFFARAREYIGKKEVPVEVPRVISGKDLLDLICEKFKLDQLKSNVILTLNESWIDLNTDLCLKVTDEVAVIPPLSGGKINVYLSKVRWLKNIPENFVIGDEKTRGRQIFVTPTPPQFEIKGSVKLSDCSKKLMTF